MQGYLNFKGYKEFAAENRPDGWNTWVTFVIWPAAPTPSAPRRMVTETVIAGPSSQRVGFRPNFDESSDVFQ